MNLDCAADEIGNLIVATLSPRLTFYFISKLTGGWHILLTETGRCLLGKHLYK
jgi:hypothetical protein